MSAAEKKALGCKLDDKVDKTQLDGAKDKGLQDSVDGLTKEEYEALPVCKDGEDEYGDRIEKPKPKVKPPPPPPPAKPDPPPPPKVVPPPKPAPPVDK